MQPNYSPLPVALFSHLLLLLLLLLPLRAKGYFINTILYHFYVHNKK